MVDERVAGLSPDLYRRTHRVLREVFGLQSFRPRQEEIIGALLNGVSVVGILPTGAGKSLCYQLPSQILGGLTVVVSPLIALMRDQVARLQGLGIGAAALTHQLNGPARGDVWRRLRAGELSLLYVAPERIRRPELEAALRGVRVALLVVDEAHLISEWGHDFRPDYRAIAPFRERLGRPPLLAVTATATPRVQEDIVRALGLDGERYRLLSASVDRPNLRLEVAPARGRREVERWLLSAARAGGGGRLFYADSRAAVEDWARFLQAAGAGAVAAYHAGMAAGDRQAVEAQFLGGDVDIVVATTAFGMGVDRSDIRVVGHVGMPDSLDAYYQEIGRAGRDDGPARAVLLWTEADVSRRAWRLQRERPDRRRLDAVLSRLEARLAPGRAGAVTWPTADGMVPIVLSRLEEMGYLRLEHKGVGQARAMRGEAPWPTGLGDVLWSRLSRHHALRMERFQAVERYARSGSGCRRTAILAYFGERARGGGDDCCDLCDRAGPSREPRPGRVAPADPDLIARLKAWRRETARREGVPPYRVFSDRALDDIARLRPGTPAALRLCHGVGPVKLARYGQAILAVVQGTAATGPPPPGGDESARGRAFFCFDQGMSLPEVADRVNRSVSTVVGYLEAWIWLAPLAESRAYVRTLMSDAVYQRVEAAIRAEGPDRLAPIKERVGDGVDYPAIRVARALWRRTAGADG